MTGEADSVFEHFEVTLPGCAGFMDGHGTMGAIGAIGNAPMRGTKKL